MPVFVCLLVLAATARAIPPAPPLVTNGDFEDATVSPWITSGTWRLAGPAEWVAASGSNSLELISYGSASKDISTTAGQRYDLSFAYAGNPSATCTPVKTLDVSWNGDMPGYGASGATFSFDTTGHTTAGMGWQIAHVLVDAAASPTRIQFTDYNDPVCGVTIDKVAMGAPSAGQTGVQLTTGPYYLTFGEAIPLTATVLGSSSSVTPTGSVQFGVDGAPAGAPVTLSGGQAQRSVPGILPGVHTVTASYTPDGGAFTAGTVTRRVNVLKAQTSTALSVETSPAPLGQAVTVTADVDVLPPGAGPLSGSVQFGDEFGPIGDPVDVDADGIAKASLIEDVGNHGLYANYAGDDLLTPSTGYGDLIVYDPNQPATASKARTVTKLVSSKNPVAPGESYTVTASVAPTTPSDAPLDGTLTFTLNGVQVGDPLPLDAKRSAGVTLTAPSEPARQTVQARYSGNAHFLGSTGGLRIFVPGPLTTPARPLPPAPDTVPPIFTAAVTRVQLARALRSGIRVVVACNERCSSVVKLALPARQARALGMHPRGASIVVAHGSYDFVDRSTATIRVRFSARARKALAKAKRLSLRLTAVATDLSRNHAVLAKSLVLKR